MTLDPFAKLDLRTARPVDPGLAPVWAAQLEEVAAAEPADWGAALAFAIDRIVRPQDPRPLGIIATREWIRQRGRPYARGFAKFGVISQRLLLISVDKTDQAIWALEETLKSGAVAGAIGTLEAAPFVASRRFDFAAKAGQAMGVLLRVQEGQELTAAKVRWRIAAAPSAADPLDAKAPGGVRWRAEVVRRRDGPPAMFEWEESDATPRLRLAAGLAGDGLVAAGRTIFAA